MRGNGDEAQGEILKEGTVVKLSPGFVVNSIMLLLATAFLSCAIVSYIVSNGVLSRTKAGFDRQYRERRLKREIRKYSRAVSIRMSLLEKAEIFLIDKSNIRRYIPFMNIYTLFFVSAAIFTAVVGPVCRMLLFIPSAVVLSGLFALIPFFVLDLMGRYNSEKIRRKLAEFISVLSRWCAVKEDIFYAFEKSIDSGIAEPLKSFMRDMTIQVRLGVDPAEALDMLQLKVDNIQFRDFVVNIKQNIRFRGDINRLLANLEAQFYKLEEEYNRRKISTYKDRLLIFVLMICVLLIGYFFFRFNERVEQFYLSTFEGKTLMAIFIMLFAFGVYFSFGITRFKH